MSHFKPVWSNEDNALLAKLWTSTKETSRQIMGYFSGRTRNAVIGRVHRMGLADCRPLGVKSLGGTMTGSKKSPKRSRKKQSLVSPSGVERKRHKPSFLFCHPNKEGKLTPPWLEGIKPIPIEPRIEKSPELGVSLYKIGLDQCRAPLGKHMDEEFRREVEHYCGDAVFREGASWCPSHAKVFLQPPRQR